MERLLIDNVRVVRPGDAVRDGAVLVEDGRIVGLESPPGSGPVSGPERLDGGGRLLTPGLVDLHTHGLHEYLYDNGPEELCAAAAELPHYGCTCALPTIVPKGEREVLGRLEQLADCLPSVSTAALPGLHVEGPFMAETGAACLTMAGDTVLLAEILAACKGRLAVMSVSPETPNVIPIIETLVENGVTVFLTHTRATVEDTQRAIEAGAHHATHFYNVFFPLAETDLGVRPVSCVEAILADRRVSLDFICDGVHVHPTAIKMGLAAKGPESVILITDSSIGAGLPAGEYDTSWGFRIRVAPGKGARIIGDHPFVGALAGSSLTMNQGIANLMGWLDLPPDAIWAMGTTNPARLVGLETKGRIDIGADADLVLWNDDFTPHRTWVGGRCVYEA